MHCRYLTVLSIKDHEHMRWLRKSTIASSMLVQPEIVFSEVSQKVFLNSSYNKQKFLCLIVAQLEADHHDIVRCAGDADSVVVSTIPDNACTGGNVELIAADTDLLIMQKCI